MKKLIMSTGSRLRLRGVGDVYRELSEVRVYKLERPLREFLLEVVVRGCDVYGGRKADPTDLDVPL